MASDYILHFSFLTAKIVEWCRIVYNAVICTKNDENIPKIAHYGRTSFHTLKKAMHIGGLYVFFT